MAQVPPEPHPDAMPPADDKALQMRTRFVGSRIDLRAFESGKPLALHPLTIRAGERGLAVLFRFGAVALVDVSPVEEAAFFEALAPFVVGTATPRAPALVAWELRRMWTYQLFPRELVQAFAHPWPIARRQQAGDCAVVKASALDGGALDGRERPRLELRR